MINMATNSITEKDKESITYKLNPARYRYLKGRYGLRDDTIEKKYGKKARGGIALFEASEMGYGCPKSHRGDTIVWSEFNDCIWCHKCQYDYPSEECPIIKPDWMSLEEFYDFINKLPFKPILKVDKKRKKTARR